MTEVRIKISDAFRKAMLFAMYGPKMMSDEEEWYRNFWEEFEKGKYRDGITSGNESSSEADS